MSLNNFLSPKLIAGAAIVGLVGAAGVFIYEQVYAEKRRSMLVSEVQRLDQQMASMRLELEALRDLQKETQLKRQKQKRVRREVKKKEAGDTVDAPERSYASDSEYFTDYQSVLGTDAEMDSEEFYDVHTDEDDDTLRETNGISPALLDEPNIDAGGDEPVNTLTADSDLEKPENSPEKTPTSSPRPTT